MKIAVAWLLKEDWPMWQEIDSQLPPYDQWFTKIEAAEKLVTSQGHSGQRVIVRPERFKEWCLKNGKPLNSPSRSEFAAQTLHIRTTMS